MEQSTNGQGVHHYYRDYNTEHHRQRLARLAEHTLVNPKGMQARRWRPGVGQRPFRRLPQHLHEGGVSAPCSAAIGSLRGV